MPITREQKILGGVLALAGVALGVDRFILPESGTGPTPVVAAPVPSLTVVAPPPGTLPDDEIGVTAPIDPDAHVGLSERFTHVQTTLGIQVEEISDAFSSTADWAALPDVTVTDDGVIVNEITPEERIADFRAKHRLTAVMHTGDGDWAVINGDLFAPGRNIGEFRIVELTAKGVVIALDDRTFELLLPGIELSDGKRE